MRRRPRTGKSIKVCPKCGSGQIVQASGSITGAVYQCRACQYLGALVLEIDVADDGTPLK
jgi:predicted RNA-binding Zn-ribbon protein involved in translation (DUF1610 family)